jgi:hypothetical protein
LCASIVLLGILTAATVWARPGRVVTKDGKVWEGDVTERKQQNQIDIVVEGKKFTFSLDNVDRWNFDDSIEVTPPPQPAQPGQPQPGQQPGQRPGMTVEQEFEKRRAALPPNDAVARVRLARWAFERQQYDLARGAAEEALEIDSRNQEAQALLRTIDAQRRLDRKTERQPPAQPGARRPGPGAAPGQPTPGDGSEPQMQPGQQRPPAGGGGGGNALVRPLTADEVNRIRLLEWDGDRGVRVRLLNDVKRRYLARADMTPAQFNKLDAVDQAWEIKQNGSPELLNDVRITNDPRAMQEYRTVVQRAVLTGCATAACHGGNSGGGFSLHPRADHEGEAYANFLTMHKYVYKPQKGREAPMIDRNRPEDSLLIQFGLPYDVADNPHPEVEGFRPIFRTRNDARYKQFVRWIADSLAPLRDDYGVPFDEAGEGNRARPAGGADEAPEGGGEGGSDVAPGGGQRAGQGAGPAAGPGAGAVPGGQGAPARPPQRPAGGQ